MRTRPENLVILMLASLVVGCGQSADAPISANSQCVDIPNGQYFQFVDGRLTSVTERDVNNQERPPETARRIGSTLAGMGYPWVSLDWNGQVVVVSGVALDEASRSDAFIAANRVSETLFNLVAGGALGSAFIPTFTGLLAKDDKKSADEIKKEQGEKKENTKNSLLQNTLKIPIRFKTTPKNVDLTALWETWNTVEANFLYQDRFQTKEQINGIIKELFKKTNTIKIEHLKPINSRKKYKIANNQFINYMLQFNRDYTYSTAMSPFIASHTLSRIKTIRDASHKRAKLNANIALFKRNIILYQGYNSRHFITHFKPREYFSY